MLRITASGIGAGPGEKLASGIDGSNGQMAPVSAGCGSTAIPSTLSEALDGEYGEAVSTHTVEIVPSSEASSSSLTSALGGAVLLLSFSGLISVLCIAAGGTRTAL